MRNFKQIIATALLALSLTTAAQNSDSVNLKLVRWEKVLSKLPKISGYLNFRYQYSEDANSFDLRRARLTFKGDLSPMFDYQLQLELMSNNVVLDGFVRAKIRPWLQLQAGEFKLPFTLENIHSPQKLEFIDMPTVINKLCSYQDLSGIRSNGRDIGVMASGFLFKHQEFHRLEYSLGLFNGAGINTRDNNKSKDWAGRLKFYPLKELVISFSGYVGEMVQGSDLYERRDRWSGGIHYDNGKVNIRGEYLGGNTAGLRSDGFYVVAGYTFWNKLSPLLRFDFFREDITHPELDQTGYAVGLSYWATRFVRCQLNYTYTVRRDGTPNGQLLSAMVSLVF